MALILLQFQHCTELQQNCKFGIILCCKWFRNQYFHKGQNQCTWLQPMYPFTHQNPVKKPLPKSPHNCYQHCGRKKKRSVRNIQAFDFKSVCMLERSKGPIRMKAGYCTRAGCVVECDTPRQSTFQSAWAICFTYLEREREREKRAKHK